MKCSRFGGVLTAAMLGALPGAALAQFPPAPGGAPPSAVQDRWPDPPKTPQAAPARPARPGAAPATSAAPAPPSVPGGAPVAEEALEAPKKPAAPPAPATVVACNGVFAKDSTHLKLAIKYDSRNITYGQVEGPEGSKLPGSILYPTDPRRRLEVLWDSEAGRSGTSVIAINGKSQWTAPKGMKLGLTLAALEKANGKPFKITGFDKDGTTSVAGWEGGALSNIPGGCKMGMRLHADAKAPEEARSNVTGDKELLSSDANVRAMKPTVVEILIGY